MNNRQLFDVLILFIYARRISVGKGSTSLRFLLANSRVKGSN